MHPCKRPVSFSRGTPDRSKHRDSNLDSTVVGLCGWWVGTDQEGGKKEKKPTNKQKNARTRVHPGEPHVRHTVGKRWVCMGSISVYIEQLNTQILSQFVSRFCRSFFSFLFFPFFFFPFFF